MEQGDALANIMYYAWIKHGIEPTRIYNMSAGELRIIRAFYCIEIENMKR